jgi:hypothetical protein
MSGAGQTGKPSKLQNIYQAHPFHRHPKITHLTNDLLKNTSAIWKKFYLL